MYVYLSDLIAVVIVNETPVLNVSTNCPLRSNCLANFHPEIRRVFFTVYYFSCIISTKYMIRSTV